MTGSDASPVNTRGKTSAVADIMAHEVTALCA